MKLLYTVIAFYLGCYLEFSMQAIFDMKGWYWDYAYYLCNDVGGGGWLVWTLLYMVLNERRKTILPILIFSIIVFLWDSISYPTKMGVNNPIATGVIFGCALLTVSYFLARDLWYRKKQLKE